MTQFGSPSAPGGTYRERAFPTQPLRQRGIEETLRAPGLAVLPAVSEGAMLADELGAALNIGARGVLATLQAREQQRLRQEAIDEKNAEVFEGQAVAESRPFLAGRFSEIEQRKILPGLTDEEIGEQATDIIEAHLERSGTPAAYNAKFHQQARGPLIQALIASRDGLRTENQDAVLGTLSAGLDETGLTPGRIQQIMAAGRTQAPGRSDPDFYGKTIVPAMKRAADRGDTARVQMLADALPDQFATEKQAAAAKATFEQEQARSRTDNEVNGEVAAATDRAAYLNAGTFDEAIDLIGQHEASGRITKDFADRQRANVKQAQTQAVNRATALIVDAQIQTWKQRVSLDADDLFQSGRSYRIEEAEFTDAAGNSHSVSREDQLKSAFQQGVRRIAARGLPADQTQAEIIRLATANDYAPPNWTRLLSEGHTAATEATLTGPIPDTTASGLSLYRDLRAKSPTLLGKMVDKATEDFYETALVAQEESAIGAGTPDADRQALLVARRIVSERGAISDATAKELADAAGKMGQFWGPLNDVTYKNTGEVSGMIARMSRLYVRSGKSAEDAVKRAAEKLKPTLASVNGWAVRTNQAVIPEEVRPQFPSILEGFVKTWADKHAESDGYKPDDLSVRYNPNSGTWFIVDAGSGLEVSAHGDPDSIATTTIALLRRFDDAQRQQAATELEAAKQAVLNPRAPAGVMYNFDNLVRPVGPMGNR